MACGSTIGGGRGRISGDEVSLNGQSSGYSGPDTSGVVGCDVRGPEISGIRLAISFVGDTAGDASETSLLFRKLDARDKDLRNAAFAASLKLREELGGRDLSSED